MQTDYIDIDRIAAALIDTLSHGARVTLERRGDQIIAVVSQPGMNHPAQTFAGSLVRCLTHTAAWAESVTKEQA